MIKRGNGQSPINGGLSGKINYKWGIFQQATFDYRRVEKSNQWDWDESF
jgi:hypothetical protein